MNADKWLEQAAIARHAPRRDAQTTLPRRVLKRLDALARAAGQSRSGYIAHLTLEDRRSA